MNQLHALQRVRHELRRRQLTVTKTEYLTPHMRRIEFASPDLATFVSASFDDHIKMFFPATTQHAECMRDYTPRSFDLQQNLLTIEFSIHNAGPATQWARNCSVGDTIEIGGPRGSIFVPDDFDWYMLIGDSSGMPAIGRRLEELRENVPVASLALVNDIADKQTWSTRAAWKSQWVLRNTTLDDAITLCNALGDIDVPPGDGFIWIAAEVSVARAVRSYVRDIWNHPAAWTKAAGYWRKGDAGVHENLQDEANR